MKGKDFNLLKFIAKDLFVLVSNGYNCDWRNKIYFLQNICLILSWYFLPPHFSLCYLSFLRVKRMFLILLSSFNLDNINRKIESLVFVVSFSSPNRRNYLKTKATMMQYLECSLITNLKIKSIQIPSQRKFHLMLILTLMHTLV